MRLRLRILFIIIKSLFGIKRRGCPSESSLNFFVLPSDCVVKYMGNDRYHAFLDCGRIDLLLQLVGLKVVFKKKLSPFVYTCHIMYRKPLKVFTKFNLRTRLVNIDGYYFWMEHIFEQNGQVMAMALSKNGLCHSKKIVATNRLDELFVVKFDFSMYDDATTDPVRKAEQFLRRIQW